jgi:DnaJ-class molecular chaperone
MKTEIGSELTEFLEVIKAAGVSVTLHPEKPKKPFRCPVCEGKGYVLRGTPSNCNGCNGSGVLWG